MERDRGGGGEVSAEEAVVAFSTVASPEDAERVARALVEERLAACVNVVPGLVSYYRWKGRVERDDELLLVIKTARPRVEAMRARLVELHPYEVPELIVLPVQGGHPPYLAWLAESV